ncbi:MAG: hypothetical protein ACREP7_14310 [Lysobacter sp.]
MSMGSVLIVLMVLGFVLQLYGFVWLLILAFKEHVLWGVGSLLITPVMWVYAILHWRDAKFAALVHFAGLACFIPAAVWLSLSDSVGPGAHGPV